MRIGIIGAGQIGGTLTRRFSELGHEVSVANSRGPETLRDLAEEIGARPVTTREAARSGEVVVVTIPMKSVPELPADLFEGVPDDVVVVDTGNYYPQQRDGLIPEIEAGVPESVWVERQLGRPVLKAFNNIYAEHLLKGGLPPGSPERMALPVAGDDDAAKSLVIDLVEELGFDGVDAGKLRESWRQQPGTPVYGTDLGAEGARRALAEATPDRGPDWRAAPVRVSVDEALDDLSEVWSQRVIGAANGNLIKVARGVGSTEWHTHPDQDEVFLVRSGRLVVELRSGAIELSEGDLLVVPRGVEHRTGAPEHAEFVIIGRSVTSTPEGGKPASSVEART